MQTHQRPTTIRRRFQHLPMAVVQATLNPVYRRSPRHPPSTTQGQSQTRGLAVLARPVWDRLAPLVPLVLPRQRPRAAAEKLVGQPRLAVPGAAGLTRAVPRRLIA